MFTIILESVDSKRLDSIEREGNENYLPQDDQQEFKMLGDLATCTYDVFGSSNMNNLISELEMLKERLTDFEKIDHIDEIIQLAKKCKKIPLSRLIFTPFER
ncbi:hypothetical protein [Paenibacillus kandeliae]|uniref:hypothetical protein n=1 Tax=Paenibacillus kandeliae TaxID=3231269 RepID=UPI00345A55DF